MFGVFPKAPHNSNAQQFQSNSQPYNHELLFHKALNGRNAENRFQKPAKTRDLSYNEMRAYQKQQTKEEDKSSRRIISYSPRPMHVKNANNNGSYNIFQTFNTREAQHDLSSKMNITINNLQGSFMESSQLDFGQNGAKTPKTHSDPFPNLFHSLDYTFADSNANPVGDKYRKSSPVPSITYQRTFQKPNQEIPESSPNSKLPLKKQDSKTYDNQRQVFSPDKNFQNSKVNYNPGIFKRIDTSSYDNKEFEDLSVYREPIQRQNTQNSFLKESNSNHDTIPKRNLTPKIFDSNSETTTKKAIQLNLYKPSLNKIYNYERNHVSTLNDVSDSMSSPPHNQHCFPSLSITLPTNPNSYAHQQNSNEFTPNIFEKLRMIEREMMTLRALNEQKNIELKAMSIKIGNPTAELKTILDERAQNQIMHLTSENYYMRERIKELETIAFVEKGCPTLKGETDKVIDLKAKIIILEREKLGLKEQYENFKNVVNNGTYQNLERSFIQIRELEEYVKRLKRRIEQLEARVHD